MATIKATEVRTRRKEKASVKPRVYFHVKDFNPISDFMSGERWNRPYKIYREILPAVLEMAGLKNCKANWSQYAGCSCGCSPGFIVQAPDFPADIHVTYEVLPRAQLEVI